MFASFFTWLSGQLNTFIFTKVSTIAIALSPAITTLATIYVMFWGYLSLTGKIQEPILEGAKRIFVMAAILIFTLNLAANLGPILDIFVNGPAALAGVISGAPTPVAAVDAVWNDGNLVAEALFAKGGLLSGWGFYFAGVGVYILVGLVCVYTAFLMALSMIAIALILVLGPMFIAFLFFDATKRFFESWIAQLANYGLIVILVALIAALLIQVVQSYTAAALAAGAGIQVPDAVRLCIIAALIFLVMRQIPSIAAGLASGIALSSFGAVSKTLAWGLGAGGRTGYLIGRGLSDRETGRHDSLRRKTGYALGQAARVTGRAVWRGLRGGNTIRQG